MTTEDNELLVYMLTERTYRTQSIDVEVVTGSNTDDEEGIQFHAFDVDDTEPLDVWGPIFSRILDHLGYTLSDPGDFSWQDMSVAPNSMAPGTYLVTINCEFTKD